jgi:hypothetical protein
MTLIVGIKCEEGIVLGADGAATFGVMGQTTIRQATKKLDIMEGCVVIGVSGPIGLGQRIRGDVQTLWQEKKLGGRKPHEAMTILRGALLGHVTPEMQMAQLSRNVIGQVGITSALCATIIALPVAKHASLFQFDQNCSPEEATENLPFVSIGSGQPIADPFLAFIRRIFWPNRLPKIGEGILATTWTLSHAIATSPGGVSDPTQIVLLEQVKGDWRARELEHQELQEHKQAVDYAENYLQAAFDRESARPEPPPSPPEQPKTTRE